MARPKVVLPDNRISEEEILKKMEEIRDSMDSCISLIRRTHSNA